MHSTGIGRQNLLAHCKAASAATPDAQTKSGKCITPSIKNSMSGMSWSQFAVQKNQAFTVMDCVKGITANGRSMALITIAIGYLVLSHLIIWMHTTHLITTNFWSKVGKKKQIQNLNQKFQTRTKNSQNRPRSRQSSTTCYFAISRSLDSLNTNILKLISR